MTKEGLGRTGDEGGADGGGGYEPKSSAHNYL